MIKSSYESLIKYLQNGLKPEEIELRESRFNLGLFFRENLLKNFSDLYPSKKTKESRGKVMKKLEDEVDYILGVPNSRKAGNFRWQQGEIYYNSTTHNYSVLAVVDSKTHRRYLVAEVDSGNNSPEIYIKEQERGGLLNLFGFFDWCSFGWRDVKN